MNPQTLSVRKLDEAIAVKLFGWRKAGNSHLNWWRWDGRNWPDTPRYTRHASSFAQVLDWLHKHEVFRVQNSWNGKRGWCAVVNRVGTYATANHEGLNIESETTETQFTGRTLPIAVCRLALWCKENP